MLSLIKLDDRIDRVCSSDPDVAVVDEDGQPVEAAGGWLAVDADGVTVGPDATIVTIRPLASSAVALIAPDGVDGSSGTRVYVAATRPGVTRFRAPGVDETKRERLLTLLDRLPYPLRVSLGAEIFVRSVLPQDPPAAAG